MNQDSLVLWRADDEHALWAALHVNPSAPRPSSDDA
jgi:hypothetical protein